MTVITAYRPPSSNPDAFVDCYCLIMNSVQSTGSLRICHVNVRSLRAESRLFDLELMSASNNIDVLCVSETWLQPTHPSSVIVPGFQPPVRTDRVHGRGGGVAIYVRDGLTAMPVSCSSSSAFECASVSVFFSRRSAVTVITAYRPPSSNPDAFVDYLEGVVDSLSRVASRKVCIVGDFNAKHSAWLPSQDTDTAGLRMYAFTVTNGFTQLVTEPTYRTVSGNDVLLDLMLTNQLNNVEACHVLPAVSDHCPTLLTLRTQRSRVCARPS